MAEDFFVVPPGGQLCSCCGSLFDPQMRVLRNRKTCCSSCSWLSNVDGKPVSRRLIEEEVAIKDDAKLMMCIAMNLDRQKTLEVTKIKKELLPDILQNLVANQLVNKKSVGVYSKSVLTAKGEAVLRDCTIAYGKDKDVELLMDKLKEIAGADKRGLWVTK